MDSNGFFNWLKWWHDQVRNQLSGPWLIIMDNCGGYELDHQISGLRIEFLPPRSTAKYQPLDLGLISHSKIRYRSSLLRNAIDILMRKMVANEIFPTDSNRGLYGMREGHKPHVADAIELFDNAWNKTSRVTVLKCSIKSNCISTTQLWYCRGIIGEMLEVPSTSIEMNIGDPIAVAEVNQMSNDVSEFQSYDVPQSPLMQVIEEAELINSAVSLMQMVNSPALHDADPSREQISDLSLQNLLDSSSNNLENLTNDMAASSTNRAENIDPDLLKLI